MEYQFFVENNLHHPIQAEKFINKKFSLNWEFLYNYKCCRWKKVIIELKKNSDDQV